MIVLYTGGQKSGKSRHAEQKAISLAASKPFYLATAEIIDNEMKERVRVHREQRENQFTTIEEPCNLFSAVEQCDDAILIDCLTIWINNMIYYERSENIFTEIDLLLNSGKDIVMVINEVGCGIIPGDPLSRSFADFSGKVAQKVAEKADEVYFCAAGLTMRMK